MAGRKSTKTAPVEPMETMGSAIKALMEEKGISEDLVFSTVESIIKDAYKQQYKPYENCVVRWNDAHDNIDVFVQKTVVDGEQYGVIDPIEISLEDARRLDPQCDIGDELLIPFNPKNLKRQSIQQARTDARKSFRSITNDKQYNEYKNKEGQLIKGYFLRQMPNGDIWVNIGTIEGLLPNRNQSPRENYDGYGVNDSILCYVESVKEDDHGVHVILSRTHSELVRKLFELQIPEIQQQQIDIVKVVRMAGMRTKVAVVSRNENIDPIGACIGLQGNRIKTIMDEIEGERIDIVRYDSNPVNYIRNALAPAEVKDIVVIDKNVFQAVAIVDKSQQALAIGKQGVNVRLASKLCDWMIEVKTQEEFDEYLVVLFKRMGYRSEAVSSPSDPGVDVLLYRDTNDLVVVYAPLSKERIGNEAVDAALDAMKRHKAQAAWIITNSRFEKKTIRYAKDNKLRLVDRKILMNIVDRATRTAIDRLASGR